MAAQMFAPYAAAGGGAVLGAAAVARAALSGSPLGFSGEARAAVTRGDARGAALVLGTIAAGACSSGLLPGAVVGTLGLGIGRAGIAGLATGLGTALAGGCTSGHGICGLSTLSPRSLVAVGAFMASGAATAVLAGTPAALGMASPTPGAAFPILPGPEPLSAVAASVLLAAIFGLFLGSTTVALAARQVSSEAKRRLKLAGDLLVGGVAGIGLAASGMGDPARVAGFLALGQGAAWDPSLIFVMGGAIAVALPGFKLIQAFFAEPAAGGRFCLPASTWEKGVSADLPRLVGGSVLFGVGWGLSGLCPGPMLLQFGAGPLNPALLAALVGMAAGFLTVEFTAQAKDRTGKEHSS